jgi:PAS domain S-box-containing protein
MHPFLKRIVDLPPNQKGKSILLHIAIIFLVLFPVIVMSIWGSVKIVMFLMLGVSILIALLLSWLITALNVYRQKEDIFLANAGDALVVIDRSWKIELWNKTAEVLTGWNANEVIGKSFRDVVKFIREKDQSETVGFIEEAMLYGRVGTLEDHTYLIRKDGLQIPIGDSAAPLFDPRGTVIGAIIIFRDKSKEHDLEAARQEFIAMVSRELRTPLLTIRDYISRMISALKMTAGDLQTREYSEEIQKANERIFSLVDTMSAVLTIEQGELSVVLESISLSELATKVLTEFESEIQAKNIVAAHHFDESLPLMNLDMKLARSILQNLVSNAVKYTPEGGTVSMGIKRGDEVVISVTDSGIGIPKEQQNKVFSKLFVGKNVKSKGLEGIGLGLYMVKLIVEESGGKMWFESEENKGSTFYVSYPNTGMRIRHEVKNL